MLIDDTDDLDFKNVTVRMMKQESKICDVLERYDQLLARHKIALETNAQQEEQIGMLLASLNQKQYSKTVQKRTLSARQTDKNVNN